MVIVVFLVGILAVVQIFPKGFQILLTSRSNAQASALGRDLVEHLKASPDQIPDAIIAVHYVLGLPIEDPNRNIYDLGPQGDSVDQNGNLFLGGTLIGNWQLYSGANSFRRIIGEGQRVPAPRVIGSNYGCLRVLAFGPIDANNTPVAYANDLGKSTVLPSNLSSVATQNVVIGGNSVTETLYDTPDSLTPYEYFIDQAGTPNAVLYLPTNGQFDRTYHISLSAYVGTVSAFFRQDYPDFSVKVLQTTQKDGAGNTPPLIGVPISAILSNTPGALQAGQTMASVEYDSIRLQPQYNPIANNVAFGADPFQFKLLDSRIGDLLFNPAAYSTFIEKTGGAREPLLAKVNYDVEDWRILRQDFRLDSQLALNGGNYAQFQLALPSILVGTQAGPDGLPNGVMPLLENPATLYDQSDLADNLVLIDLQTGGVVSEYDPNNTATQLVTINKSTGMVTIHGAAGSPPPALNGYVLLPGTNTPVSVDLTSRPLRVLYRARNNWAMFPTKAASSYSIVGTSPPAEGQVFVPNTPTTRIYFPKSDLHQKVTIDEIFYVSGSTPHELDGQDFVIEYPTVPDAVGLPCIDVQSADSSATALSNTYGAVARGIKGASLTVQVIWNPATFQLGSNGSANIGALDQWGRNWRRSTNQTYLQSEEIQ